MTATGKTREAVIVFFDAVIERRFSDADKALEEVRSRKNPNPEFQDGYIKALEGILTSARSGDERDFLNKVSYTEGSESMVRTGAFLMKVGQGVDLGFFSAGRTWSFTDSRRTRSLKRRSPEDLWGSSVHIIIQ
jgi:hypothetical protein